MFKNKFIFNETKKNKQKDDVLVKIIIFLITLMIFSIGSFILDFSDYLNYTESTYGFVVENRYRHRPGYRYNSSYQDVTVQYEVAGEQHTLDFSSRKFQGSDSDKYKIGDKVKVIYNKDSRFR